MPRVHTYFLFVASAALSAVVVAQQPVFRGSGDAVRIFATVTDGDGRLVTSLGREDFDVRDEGRPQPLTLFDNSPQPIKLIVMLDVSGSMEGNLPLLRAATEELLPRLRPDDAVRLGAFGRDVQISPAFTRNPTELLAALPRTIEADAPTPLWRALDDAMDAFGDSADAPRLRSGQADERRVVLVLSDGRDSGPISFRQRYVSQVEVIDRARDDEVMIYAVAMRSRPARRGPPAIGAGALAALTADLPDPGLARVAEETGGGFIEIRFGEDLSAAFARVADELHAQYLLAFAPPRRDGRVHDVEVRVVKRGLKARGRKTYVAPRG
jgi:Ca-activated chloride channel family protein